jgi:cell division protein FtsW
MSLRVSRNISVDSVLVGTTMVLIGLGAVMIASSSVGKADDDLGNPLYYLEQHLLALSLGLVGLTVALRVPIDWWNRLASVLLAVAFAVLVLVLLPGVSERINGAKRWLEIGPVSLQASELARVLILIYLASYAVRQLNALRSGFQGFARPMLIVGLAAILLLQEPDFGATVVLTASSLGILFIAGARLRDVALTSVAAGGAFALLIWSSPYRWNRILNSFLDPWQDQYDTGYQLVNSFIAIGSGSWFGAGLGAGVQKLHYLPEPHTDFIFAVLAEELGFIGASGVIVLFGLLVWRAISLGQQAIRRGMLFHGLLAIGVGLTIGLEASISVGVNTGLLPTKGLTLPLISYGRTSVVMTLFALGLLLRVSSELADQPATESERRSR